MCWRTDRHEFLLPRVLCQVHPLSLVSSTGGASALSARRAGLLPEVPTEEERSSDGAGEVEVKMCSHVTHAHMLRVRGCFLTAPVPPEGIYCARWTCRTGAAYCCWMTERCQRQWRRRWPEYTETMEPLCAASGSTVSRGGSDTSLRLQIQVEKKKHMIRKNIKTKYYYKFALL